MINMVCYRRQKGVALIIVLLIVAIVSVVATEMGTRLQLQVKRASNIKQNNQAYWYALGAEQFAQKSLKTLVQEEDTVHLNQPWSQEFAFPIEGGGIEAQLVDLQSCFNLNALAVDPNANPNPSLGGSGPTEGGDDNPPAGKVELKNELEKRLTSFEKLLSNIEADIPSYNIEILRDSLVDWLDKDSITRGLGAEDSEYESRVFPYMAANNYMVHKSELRLVNGIEYEWLAPVLDLVCVIPNDESLKINVNTISEENASIVAALTGLDVNQAASAISARGEQGFEKIEDFLNTPELKSVTLDNAQKQWFDVKTSYFMLQTKAQYHKAQFSLQTVFKIDNDKNVHVISREFSGF